MYPTSLMNIAMKVPPCDLSICEFEYVVCGLLPFLFSFQLCKTCVVFQILSPGLYILLKEPFGLMVVPCLFLTFLVTIIGVHRTPAAWLGYCPVADKAKLGVAVKTFTKICIVFVIYTVRLS